MTTAPFGLWPSPITPELLTAQAVRLSDPQAVGEYCYWLEMRPWEKGRNVLVCEHAGTRRDMFAAPISVRTRAQEYGGSSYLATAEAIFYVQDSDQRIYEFNLQQQHSRALTPEGEYRYADFCVDPHRQRLIAVRENYSGHHHPEADIIAIDLQHLTITQLVQGADFYSNPRISPDGKRLSYLRWFHPQMPWDGSECLVAELDEQGAVLHEHLVAGGKNESIFQPQWSAKGELIFVSDRSNWWNIYRWNGATTECLCSMAAEFATPQWVFGMSTYGFLNDQEIFCCYTQHGQWNLGIIALGDKTLRPVPSGFRDIAAIHCHNGNAYFIAASATQASQLWRYAQGDIRALNGSDHSLDPAYFSRAEPVEFATTDGEIAHGFFYSPTNPAVTAPAGTRPPLLVVCHGGPTGATETGLNLKIQFWTSRGFAVLDVNYRGSTGYGRHYRDRLKNQWGITDVIDACSGVDYLIAQQRVDANKIAIRGSSAGGYTALAALTFSDHFKAGASLYGIGDLEALARDTHKFEAHYLDSLVGTYPKDIAIYHARSPIHHIGQLNCPVIFLQGLQDKVVPPAQAEAMVSALNAKGIHTEYVAFPEEGHGFRQAHNIQRALAAELNFYINVFGLNGD